jgi:hypothetical protein
VKKEEILDAQYWKFSDYRQRITTKNWKILLLNDDDKIIFYGRMVQLVAISLGYGIVEISKKG